MISKPYKTMLKFSILVKVISFTPENPNLNPQLIVMVELRASPLAIITLNHWKGIESKKK